MVTRLIPYRVEDGQGNLVEQGTYTVEVPQEQVNDETLRERLRTSQDANRAYLAIATPTAAQTTAQVKALTRQMLAQNRLALGDLSEAD